MNNNAPNVLVLLAAYNGANWITEQIESILSQESVELKLIVSDDQSSDDTVERAAQFKGDSRITILRSATPSGSAAQHFISLMRNTPPNEHEFIAFSDQDDIWLPHKLAKACASLSQTSSAGYSCATLTFGNVKSERVLHQCSTLTVSDFLFEGAGQGCTFVITKAFYSELRTFLLENQKLTSRIHYHDWMIYSIARASGLSWVFDRTPLLKYRQHSRNDTGARTSVGALIRRLRLISRGWYADQIMLITCICSKIAPNDQLIAEWCKLLLSPRGPCRSMKITKFCVSGGRRRLTDRTILILSALVGRI